MDDRRLINANEISQNVEIPNDDYEIFNIYFVGIYLIKKVRKLSKDKKMSQTEVT